jgi:aryl-alcohol dehydrogenase-like predicted oxidoreductase
MSLQPSHANELSSHHAVAVHACREAVEASLKYLGVDHIDLFYLHRWGAA